MSTAVGRNPNGRTSDRLDSVAVIVLVVCCAIWGINQVAIKIANSGISPVMHAGLRSFVSACLVFVWARVRGVRLFERDGTLAGGVLCGVLFAGEFIVLYTGLDMTTASRGVLLLYLAPFVVAFGSHYLIPGDRLTPLKFGGLCAALAGLGVAMGEGFSAPGQPTLRGDVLCVLGAILWGATTIVVRASRLRTAAPEKTLLYQLVASAVLLPAVSLALGEPGVHNLTPKVLAAFAYTSVVVAFVTYLAWFWLVRTYPPMRVSSFTFLTPVFGVVAGNVMLGEPLSPSLGVALVMVAAGIYLVNRPASS
ncbi:MAG: DMT family transporter [Hyphomicrobiaceae bacterium]